MPEEHKAGKVLFVITTDGLENSSEEYSYNDIRRLIETKKECGWEFLFLGANIDAGKEAEKIGIARDRSVTYENDSKGVLLNICPNCGQQVSDKAKNVYIVEQSLGNLFAHFSFVSDILINTNDLCTLFKKARKKMRKID